MKKCKVCGHKWKPRKDYTRFCPHCTTPLWEEGYNQKCGVCDRIIMIPEMHHKDGNVKNNHPNNKIVLCQTCNKIVHTGMTWSKDGRRGKERTQKSYGNVAQYRIKELRSTLLQGRKKK